jgi:glucose-1-phosphatase
VTSPSGTSLRAIIFDIGRVIVRVDYDRALRLLSSSASRSGKEVWQLISSDPRMLDFQEGRLTPQEWHEHLNQLLNMNLSYEEFYNSWTSALDPQPIIPDGVFAELVGRYHMALLSNTDPIHVAYMESTFSFMRFFPSRIYSCAVGKSKPDPAIYRFALDAVQTPPADTLYIDDVAAYVEAGRKIGLQTILFRDLDSLLKDLRALGALR